MSEERPFSAPGRRELAAKSLLLAKQVFEKIGVPFWLVCGTMLGAIRDHDFIPHDSDIDIGLWGETPDHSRIKAAFLKAEFKLVAEYGREDKPGHQYAFWSPSDVYIDLFFHEREADRCWLPLWVDGECKKCVYPPITEFILWPFCGEQFPIPLNYEEVLVAQYGKDWQIPVAPIERGGEWRWDSSARNME